MQFVDKEMHHHGIKFFRTQSPRHFEGGDWDQGGSCNRIHPLLAEQVRISCILEVILKNAGTCYCYMILRMLDFF